MYMAIASDQRLRNHGAVLPPSWRTLYELTRLSDEAFEERIADGTIHPGMERADVEGRGVPGNSFTEWKRRDVDSGVI
jgi:hypothetical protein